MQAASRPDATAMPVYAQVKDATRGAEEHQGSTQGLRDMLTQQMEEAQQLKVLFLTAYERCSCEVPACLNVLHLIMALLQ